MDAIRGPLCTPTLVGSKTKSAKAKRQTNAFCNLALGPSKQPRKTSASASRQTAFKNTETRGGAAITCAATRCVGATSPKAHHQLISAENAVA